MKDKKIEIQKICGFYVNDWHFTTMILPYIRKEIEENRKVITFFQDSIQSNIEEILSKMNLNKTFEEKILKINWNKANLLKQEEILQVLEPIKESTQTIDILVKGDNEFIEATNKKIEIAIQKLNPKTKIRIINLYDLSKNQEISKITKKYEYLVNTAGMQKIENKKEA